MGERKPVETFLKNTAIEVDKYLDQHLPPEEKGETTLAKAMRYSIFAGGKRLRPALAIAAFQGCGGKGPEIYLATSALEMIHTFSLIHDDLPCMDDDDLRRGRPTSHKIFGEATAVLAGDALCIHAFQLLAQTQNHACVETLAKALGTHGMLGGQIEDIEAEGKTVDLEKVKYIHTHKTGALIEASLLVGAQLANADQKTLNSLSQFGKHIGLAFQIVDDILDLEQTTEELGKDAGSDASNSKATYPAVIGLEKSKEMAEALKVKANETIKGLSADFSILKDLAYFTVNRVN